jgi:hypothetical protein
MGIFGRKLVELQRQKDVLVAGRGWRRQAEETREWAQAAGWRYRDSANELVGRWFPTIDGLDEYLWVVDGASNGLPVTVATRRTYLAGYTGKSEDSNRDFTGIIAIGIPGRPPEEFLQSPYKTEQAIRALGGSVPEPYELEFRTDGWLIATRGGGHKLKRLRQQIDLLTMQLGMVPVGFWRQ